MEKVTEHTRELVQKVMGEEIDKVATLGSVLASCDAEVLSAVIKSTIVSLVLANKLIIVERDT